MEKTNQTATKRNLADQSMLMNLFLDELREAYSAENLLLKTLAKLEQATTSGDLKAAFASHLVTTENHIARLDQIFPMLGQQSQGKKSEVMESLSKECDNVIGSTEDGTSTRDLALIGVCRKVENNEIATYATLVQMSKTLGKTEVAHILTQTLKEEKQAEILLANFAESTISEEALNEV